MFTVHCHLGPEAKLPGDCLQVDYNFAIHLENQDASPKNKSEAESRTAEGQSTCSSVTQEQSVVGASLSRQPGEFSAGRTWLPSSLAHCSSAYKYLYVCLHIYIHTHTYIYVYMNVYIKNTHTHIYMYIKTFERIIILNMYSRLAEVFFLISSHRINLQMPHL